MRFDIENLKEIVEHFLPDELKHLELCIFEDTGGDLVHTDFLTSEDIICMLETMYPKHTTHIAYNLLKLDVEIKNEKAKNMML